MSEGRGEDIVARFDYRLEHLSLEDVAHPKMDGVLLQPKRNMLTMPIFGMDGPNRTTSPERFLLIDPWAEL